LEKKSHDLTSERNAEKRSRKIKTKNTEAPKEVKARAGIGLSWVL